MRALVLRGRAALWAAITLLALTLPWSRKYCDPGQLRGVAIAAAAALSGAALGVAVLRRSYGWVRQDDVVDLPAYWSLIAIAAFGEEVLFRGVLMRAAEGWWGAGPAILASSVLFGAAHWSRTQPRNAAVHVLTGAIFGTVAWVTGGWLAGAAVHIVYNCVAWEWRPAMYVNPSTVGMIAPQARP